MKSSAPSREIGSEAAEEVTAGPALRSLDRSRLRDRLADHCRQESHEHRADERRDHRLPTAAIVGRVAFRLGEHEHEEEGHEDRPGVNDQRGNGQELGPGQQEQSGRAGERHAEPDGAVDRGCGN